MSRTAVTARLRQVGDLLANRGLVDKTTDMSAAAVTDRLRTLGALSDMCRRLGTAGKTLKNIRGTSDR